MKSRIKKIILFIFTITIFVISFLSVSSFNQNKMTYLPIAHHQNSTEDEAMILDDPHEDKKQIDWFKKLNSSKNTYESNGPSTFYVNKDLTAETVTREYDSGYYGDFLAGYRNKIDNWASDTSRVRFKMDIDGGKHSTGWSQWKWASSSTSAGPARWRGADNGDPNMRNIWYGPWKPDSIVKLYFQWYGGDDTYASEIDWWSQWNDSRGRPKGKKDDIYHAIQKKFAEVRKNHWYKKDSFRVTQVEVRNKYYSDAADDASLNNLYYRYIFKYKYDTFLHTKQIKFFNQKIILDSSLFNKLTSNSSSLLELLHWKSNEFGNSAINNSLLTYSNLKLDKTKRTISGKLSYKKDNGHYTNEFSFEVPIHIVGFNYLTRFSNFSSSVWDHKIDGTKQYWQNKPETKIILNNDYFKTLRILTSKNQLLDQIQKDSEWNFKGTQKNIAISKINNYQLNVLNYKTVKSKFIEHHLSSVLVNLKQTNRFKQILKTNQWDEFIPELQIYQQVLSSSKIEYKTVNIINNKQITKSNQTISKESLDFNENIKIDDSVLNSIKDMVTFWNTKVYDVSVKFRKITSPTKIELDDPNQLKHLYDLKVKYDSLSELSIEHVYTFQNKPININKDISFILEDGTILDQNFKVVKPGISSKLSKGQNGWIKTRYLTHAKRDEYIVIKKQSDGWWSKKYNKKVEGIDSSFKDEDIEYVFNEKINFIINPYGSTNKNWTKTTMQSVSYAVQKVSDIHNGVEKTLEDWSDGKVSHATINSKPVFDGIFGTDMQGKLDTNSLLGEGNHKLKVKLYNASSLKQNFNITIDQTKVHAKVKGVRAPLEKRIINIKNIDHYEEYPLYYSQSSIEIDSKENDIYKIELDSISSNGKWTSIPVEIKNVKQDGIWTLKIHSVINYGGFYKVKILDQALNEEIMFFKTQEDLIPKIELNEKDFFKKDGKVFKRKFLEHNVYIANKPTNINIFDPLINDIKISKVAKGTYAESSCKDDYDITNIPFKIDPSLVGNTLDSGRAHEKLLGDWSHNFFSKYNDKETAWKIKKESINFKNPGLYKVTLLNKLLKENEEIYYIYVKEQSSELDHFIAKPTTAEESVNFDSTQFPKEHKDFQPKETKQKIYQNNQQIDYWPFLIDKIEAKFSYMWYTDFYDIDLMNEGLLIKKEGKWKLKLTNIFGDKFNKEIFVMGNIKYEDRLVKNNLVWKQYDETADFSKEEERASWLNKHAFWKGINKYNIIRFEDKDHAIWEHDKFIAEALAHGLSLKQAEWLYTKSKLDPSFDGKFADIPPSKMQEFLKWKMSTEQYKSSDISIGKTSMFSDSSKIGAIVGGVLGTSSLMTILIILIIKRRKLKIIK